MVQDDEERRWAEADAILRGALDADVSHGIRRRRARALVITLVIMVSAVALGAAIGIVAATRHHDAGHVRPPSSEPLWVEIVSFAVVVLGLLVGAAGVVRLVRAGQFVFRWKAPTAPLNRAQKRQLRQQVAGRAPADPARLPLARDLAERAAKSRGGFLVFAGLAISQIGTAIGSPSAGRFAFVTVLCLFSVVATVFMERDLRRARRFLDQHPDDAQMASSI